MCKISFLFGCGISIPAGLPSTLKITDEMLCNWDKWYKCDTQYLQKDCSDQTKEFFENNPYSDYPRKIAFFLNLINNEIKQYYGFVAKIDSIQNYEEIYDLVYHLQKALSRDIENPLTNRIIQSLVHSIEPIYPRNQDIYQELKLLCNESLQFIKNVVNLKLLHKNSCLDYLGIISEIVKEKEVNSIFTLNHDILLESYLKKELIEYYDGFNNVGENGVRLWNPDFQSNQYQLYYLKLHGSVDWYNFRRDDQEILTVENVGVVENWASKDEVETTINGTKYRTDKSPYFLTGTNDKYLEYNYGLYLELFHQFHILLKKTDFLIIAGYGFGDNAVNLRIIDWFSIDKSKKIVVITPSVDSTIKNARGAIHSRLQEWSKGSRIQFVEKGIQDVKIEDINF